MSRRSWICVGLVVALASSATALAEDVNDVVAAWTAHLERNPKSAIHGTALVFTYDEVFQTETRGRIEFWIDESVGWRLDSAPMPVDDKESRKIGPNGAHYQLKSRSGFERWSYAFETFQSLSSSPFPRETPVRRSVKIKDVDAADKSAFPVIVFRPAAWFRFPVPTLLPGVCAGLPWDESSPHVGRRQHDWQFKLGSLHGKNTQIHLVLSPKAEELSKDLSRLEILLEGTTFEPIAVRVIDSAGSSENVYLFDGIAELKQPDEAFSDGALAEWPPRCEPLHYSVGLERPPAPPVARVVPQHRTRPPQSRTR